MDQEVRTIELLHVGAMDEFISSIQFHTAVPFGYLLFFMAWISLCIWAIKNITTMVWRREFRSVKLYAMMILLVVNFGYAYASIIYSENIDLNPSFSEMDLVGEWVDGSSKVVLSKEGKAELYLSKDHLARLEIENGSGYWYKEHDFNILIGSTAVHNVSKSGVLRVIKYGESYRIIIEDYGDRDMWDGHLGFKRKYM